MVVVEGTNMTGLPLFPWHTPPVTYVPDTRNTSTPKIPLPPLDTDPPHLTTHHTPQHPHPALH